MTLRRLALVLVLCSVPGAAAGQSTPGERVYIAAGSEFAYAVLDAPLPVRQLGVIAVAALDSLRDPRTVIPTVTGATTASPASPGRASDSAAPGPAGWPASLPLAGKAPLATIDGPRPDGSVPDGPVLDGSVSGAPGRCDCATVIGHTGDHRVAALYAARTFLVAGELPGLRVLRLRVRYRDGLIAYINGHEVARRNIDAAAGSFDIALRPHGPEWETFYIPVAPGLLVPGKNRLALEIRPSPPRLGPYLDVELTSSERPHIVRGPMVQRVSATSATIAFDTDLPVTAAVEYGPDASLGRTASSAGGGLAMHHVVELADLAPGGAVHYRLIAGGQASQEWLFHTTPAPGQPIRFAVYGDVRGGHDTHGAIVASVIKEAPDFVVVTGDMVLRGTDEGDWQRFFAVTSDMLPRVAYYPVIGNHDMGRSGDEQRRMNEMFELWPGPEKRPSWGHWYSFDVADVHFVMLDSNAYEHAGQLAWLERDLAGARARGVRAIFAGTHDGPFSRGYHQGNAHAAQHYVPVLARHGVTLTFAGHDHLYQRGDVDGFSYIVTGGGGAPLYSVRCGVPGRRRCKVRDGMRHVASEHHYIMVTVYPRHVEVCPRRPDGSPLEACIVYRLPRR